MYIENIFYSDYDQILNRMKTFYCKIASSDQKAYIWLLRGRNVSQNLDHHKKLNGNSICVYQYSINRFESKSNVWIRTLRVVGSINNGQWFTWIVLKVFLYFIFLFFCSIHHSRKVRYTYVNTYPFYF